MDKREKEEMEGVKGTSPPRMHISSRAAMHMHGFAVQKWGCASKRNETEMDGWIRERRKRWRG